MAVAQATAAQVGSLHLRDLVVRLYLASIAAVLVGAVVGWALSRPGVDACTSSLISRCFTWRMVAFVGGLTAAVGTINLVGWRLRLPRLPSVFVMLGWNVLMFCFFQGWLGSAVYLLGALWPALVMVGLYRFAPALLVDEPVEGPAGGRHGRAAAAHERAASPAGAVPAAALTAESDPVFDVFGDSVHTPHDAPISGIERPDAGEPGPHRHG